MKCNSCGFEFTECEKDFFEYHLVFICPKCKHGNYEKWIEQEEGDFKEIVQFILKSVQRNTKDE